MGPRTESGGARSDKRLHFGGEGDAKRRRTRRASNGSSSGRSSDNEAQSVKRTTRGRNRTMAGPLLLLG